MVVKIFEEKEKNLYRGFVENSDNAKIYHTLEWRSIIEKTYGYKPFYIIAKEDNEIKGILPLFEVKSFILGKRMVSIPFSHFVNILYTNQSVLRGLLRFATVLVKKFKCDYMEIKHGYELHNDINLKRSAQNYNSILHLNKPIDDIWKGFDIGSVRWGIRKAEKSELIVKQGKTLRDYKIFYELETETRKRQGSPLYPFEFFRALLELLNTNKCKLYLAYYADKPIAGIIILNYKNYSIYGYSASVSDRRYLRYQPTNLLLWTIIKDLHNLRYRVFDFGITPSSNEGLLKFKKRWGTKTEKIPYYYFLNRTKDMPIIDRTGWKIQLPSTILQRLPTSLFRTVSPILLRQLG